MFGDLDLIVMVPTKLNSVLQRKIKVCPIGCLVNAFFPICGFVSMAIQSWEKFRNSTKIVT